MARNIFFLCFLMLSCATPRGATVYKDISAPIDTSGTGQRLIVYRAEVTLLTGDFEKLNENLLKLTDKYKGFASNISNGYAVLRVPAAQLKEAVKEIATLGELVSKNTFGEDITDAFYDNVTRLENAEKTRDRLLLLLNQSKTVDEILKVEIELRRINEEMELMKGRNERYKKELEYATITVYSKKKHIPGPLGWIGLGIYYAIRALFIWDFN